MKNENENETILITGATGLVGTAVAKQIMSRFPKAQVRGTYCRTTPFFRHDRLGYVQADLTTREGCRKAVQGCNVVIMAAACTGGANAAAVAPSTQVTDNLVMDALMLDAMHREGIHRAVYLSSATVYQEQDGYVKEEDLDWNCDPHPTHFGVGWAKRASEKLCRFWHEKHGMEFIVLRCANIFGPYSKFDPAVSNFIPAIIRKAVGKMDPFEVWGSPDVSRDALFVDDLAVVVSILLESSDLPFGIFNIGMGKTCMVREVVDLSLKFAQHHPSKVVYRSDKPTTIRSRALDCHKIRQYLNWTPHFSIEQGIEKTLRWWEKNEGTWQK